MIIKLTQIVHIHYIKPWVIFWPCMTSLWPGPDFTYFMKFHSIFKPHNGFYGILKIGQSGPENRQKICLDDVIGPMFWVCPLLVTY